MKLLLAEDERRMAEALLELLRQEGYDVDWFANGIEALLAAQANVYDALILDVMLPGSDGFAITSALRREGISTPHSHAHRPRRTRGQGAGTRQRSR